MSVTPVFKVRIKPQPNVYRAIDMLLTMACKNKRAKLELHFPGVDEPIYAQCGNSVQDVCRQHNHKWRKQRGLKP